MGIILLLVGLAVVAGIALYFGRRFYKKWLEISAITVGGIVAVGLLIICIALPINRAVVRADITKFQVVAATLEIARANENISSFELAALQQKVIDYNAWLAYIQYRQRSGWMGWFNPGEIRDLKPLE